MPLLGQNIFSESFVFILSFQDNSKEGNVKSLLSLEETHGSDNNNITII